MHSSSWPLPRFVTFGLVSVALRYRCSEVDEPNSNSVRCFCGRTTFAHLPCKGNANNCRRQKRQQGSSTFIRAPKAGRPVHSVPNCVRPEYPVIIDHVCGRRSLGSAYTGWALVDFTARRLFDCVAQQDWRPGGKTSSLLLSPSPIGRISPIYFLEHMLLRTTVYVHVRISVHGCVCVCVRVPFLHDRRIHACVCDGVTRLIFAPIQVLLKVGSRQTV